MVDINQVYDTGWLKAEHLQNKPHTVTIESVTTSDFTDRKTGSKKTQLVLRFVGRRLPLGLNITNAKQVAKNLGTTESAGWIGKQITIFPTTTEMGGEMKPCIRVTPVDSRTARIPIPQLKTVENPADAMDDDIPF